MTAPMFVTATGVGFDGLVIRQPGETFQMPAGSKASWFVPHEDEPQEPQEPVKRGPGRPKKEAEKEVDGDS